ncbi:MAG TPA: hypothetical protein P5048_01880, partial [Chlamydiales bacterium]|nr:hypothetical protein [Chlamydiales bacterium]
EKEPIRLEILMKLIELQDPHLIEHIHYLNNLSIQGKIQTIKMLKGTYVANSRKIIALITNWYKLGGPYLLKKEALLFIFSHSSNYCPIEFLKLSPDPFIKQCLSLLLLKKATEKSSNPFIQKLLLQKQNYLKIENIHHSQAFDIWLETILYNPEESALKQILPLLQNPSTLIQKKVSFSLSKVNNYDLSLYIGHFLSALRCSQDSVVRTNLLTILQKVNLNNFITSLVESTLYFQSSEKRIVENIIQANHQIAIPALIEIIADPYKSYRMRIYATQLIKNLGNEKLKKMLPKIIDHEIHRSEFYFFHAKTIKRNLPIYDLKLLENSLESSYNAAIHFIIRLILTTAKYRNPSSIIHALYEKNAKAHAQAIETIEKHCPKSLFKRIYLLIDDTKVDEKLDEITLPKLSLEELLNVLGNSTCEIDRIISSKLKAKFAIPNWKESVKESLFRIQTPYKNYIEELLNQ